MEEPQDGDTMSGTRFLEPVVGEAHVPPTPSTAPTPRRRTRSSGSVDDSGIVSPTASPLQQGQGNQWVPYQSPTFTLPPSVEAGTVQEIFLYMLLAINHNLSLAAGYWGQVSMRILEQQDQAPVPEVPAAITNYNLSLAAGYWGQVSMRILEQLDQAPVPEVPATNTNDEEPTAGDTDTA